MATKSRSKSRAPVPMRTPAHGKGKLQVGGRGGGRPRDEWKAELAAMVSADDTLNHVRQVLKDPTHPHWMRALEYATERGYGKEVAPVHATGTLEVVLKDESGPA